MLIISLRLSSKAELEDSWALVWHWCLTFAALIEDLRLVSTMTRLDAAGDMQKRKEKRREVYEKVVFPMVEEMNRSPGAWLEWHSPAKKEEFNKKIKEAKEAMKKILGSIDKDLFKKLKLEAAVELKCEAVRKSRRTEANGGVRPTKAEHQAASTAILKVRWSASQTSMHMHTHAQLLRLQAYRAGQRELKEILEQNGLLPPFIEGVKIDESGELLFPWSVYNDNDVFNLTGGVGALEILVSGRWPQIAGKVIEFLVKFLSSKTS
jgi:hypothetical protein